VKDLTGTRIGQYEIVERLGGGGMAVVYRAVQQPLGREVALESRRGRIDREPDDSLAGEFFLELLHIAAAVMFLHVRALWIKPLQHNVFAFVLRQRLGLAFRIRRRNIRRSGADRR